MNCSYLCFQPSNRSLIILAFSNALNRLYSEQELNQMIKHIHPDAATLGGELVGYNMMKRENSMYHCVPASEWRMDSNY